LLTCLSPSCKEDKEDKEFTLFKRNPALKSRKGRIIFCRDCTSKFVNERGNTKQALKELCQLVDIPYIESCADGALKQYKNKIKGVSANNQTNIFNCYAKYIGIMNPSYINYSFSDDIRDDNMDGKIEKLKQLKEDLTPDKVLKEKELGSSRRYVLRFLGDDCFTDLEKLSKLIQLKFNEFDLDGGNNARQKKCQLKMHMKKLLDADLVDKEYFGFIYGEEVEENREEKYKQELKNNYDIDTLTEKWGFGYSIEELVAFEKKYQALKNNYPERTALHIEALQTYCRYRVKEEFATAKGAVKEAKDWGDLANKQAQSAKININQLSKSDLTMGLSTFGELVRMVETSVDIIPILPQFKEKPQDKPDFTLWCYVNYVRDLKGLPPAEYNDIYKFYEDRKKEQEKRLDFLSNPSEDGEDDGRSKI
jgi:hypothetical protein